MANSSNIGLFITEITEHFKQLVDDLKSNFTKLDAAFSVGYVYITADPDFDPNVSLGGHWDRLRGVFLVAADGSTFPMGSTGGHTSHYHRTAMGFDGARMYGYLGNSGAENGNPKWGSEVIPRTSSVSAQTTWLSGQSNDCRIAYTQSESNLPPYQAVNMWIRTR